MWHVHHIAVLPLPLPLPLPLGPLTPLPSA